MIQMGMVYGIPVIMLPGANPEMVYYYPQVLEFKANFDLIQDWNVKEKPLDKQKPDELKKQKPDEDKKKKKSQNNRNNSNRNSGRGYSY